MIAIDINPRVGRFTSSEIVRLMSTGKRPMTEEELAARPKSGRGSKATMVEDGPGEAFYSYIEEKRIEKKAGRIAKEDVSTRPIEWGKFVEGRAFRQLGFDYSLTSKSTIIHPTIDCWAGTPDGVNEDCVIDIKCPYVLTSFGKIAECKTINEIREKHRDGEKFYWQLVSNSILTNKKFGELVVYMPYLSEIPEIQNETEYFDGDQNKIQWIKFARPEDLPYVVEGLGYENLYVFRFPIPEQDKLRLTKRVELAARLLRA